MPVYREKETKPKPSRPPRREATTPRREIERPIITQKPPRSVKKTEPEKSKKSVTYVKDAKKTTKKEETQRLRTRTRTLSPTEVKQLTKERLAMEYQVEPKPNPTQGESDDEEYEDDFEDYESDFEEESEEEPPQVEAVQAEATPARLTDAQRRELEEVKLAMRTENEQNKSRKNSSDGRDQPRILDFSRKKIEAKKAAERAKSRGRDLLSMITLDVISYSFLDIPSIPYDVYMKLYGRSDTKQVHVQTNEDDMDEEIQTAVIETSNKWVQKPPETNKCRQTKGDRLGVGGDDVIETEPSVNVIDTTSLNDFLQWASELLLPELRRNGNTLEVEKLAKQCEEMYFSDGFVTPNTADLPFLKGKSVTEVRCVRNEVSAMLTAHTDPNRTFADSVVCVWNVNDLSKPMKILTASNRVTVLCAGAQDLVFAGLSDGSVCLWDLKESSALHRGTCDSNWVFRSPTYSTFLLTDGHESPVTSVRELREGNDSLTRDFVPIQICSLEERGVVIIWSVVRGRNLTLDEDLGLAHWGKVKLVKSSSFSVIPTLGKELPPYITFGDLAVDQSEDIEMFVTNSLGSVSHLSKYGTSMKPKIYKTGDMAETTCLEVCPFNVNYFLAGCNDGSIRQQEQPLISLNANLAENGRQSSIVSLSWLFVRPFVFFALDSLSRIHIWDLGLSDMYPEVTLNLPKKKVKCMRLIQSDNIKDRPHFVLGTMDGQIEIHRLKEDYSNRTQTEIHKDVKKFLKYVSIL